MRNLFYKISILIRIFGEGERFRDKMILFPGNVLWIASYIASLFRLYSLSNYLRVKSRPPVDVIIKNRDGRFYCRKSMDDVRLVSSGHEYLLSKHFELIKDGIFVDVGANIGKYTVKVAKQLRNNGKVISLEPEPNIFELLKTNIELNSLINVYPVNLAAWNKNEELKLLVPLDQGVTGSSTMVKEFPGNFINICANKLDDILKGLKIETVNFIKVDAEGAEPEVFEGAANTIAKSSSLKILFESYNKQHLERCTQVLKKYNMIVSEISPSGNFLAKKDKRVE